MLIFILYMAYVAYVSFSAYVNTSILLYVLVYDVIY